MSSLNAIALSGMNAAQAQLDTAGHNIANLSTGGFRRQQVQLTAQPAGGVSAAYTQAEAQGPAMETDMVAMLQAKNAFLANLQVFKTQDQITGSLLKAVG